MSDDPQGKDSGGEDLPRAPFRAGIRVSPAQLVRILGLGGLFVALAVFGRPCASGLSDFIASFSPPVEDPEPGEPLGRGEVRRLSEDEIRARFPSLVASDGGPAESDPDPETESEPEPETETEYESE